MTTLTETTPAPYYDGDLAALLTFTAPTARPRATRVDLDPAAVRHIQDQAVPGRG